MTSSAKSDAAKPAAKQADSTKLTFSQQTREMLESFAIAFMLMLLMRTCLGENYQIPTGSMAPTLQGRHMDVLCDQCGYQYRTGASIENPELRHRRSEVLSTTCPVCRFPMQLDKRAEPNHRSFSGDRIIVSKLAYWLAPPERWDVIVFKCPADAKINYIKRLVGLPGESLRIQHGDVFVADASAAPSATAAERYQIVRKPAEKVVSMMQLVDDTRYVGEILNEVQWPSRWAPLEQESEPAWSVSGQPQVFAVQAGERESWLRYRHLFPRPEDWSDMMAGHRPDLTDYHGMLITDYYAYNDSASYARYGDTEATNWVGDLIVECDVDVQAAEGELLLDLVEGGRHYTCRIDLTNAQAQLSINGGQVSFQDEAGTPTKNPTASTPLQGPGSFRLRFANVDDQLFLWVDGKLIEFAGPTTFQTPSDVTPHWSPTDPGDLMPVGVGARRAQLTVTSLRVFRDVYYTAIQSTDRQDQRADYPLRFGREEVYDTLSNPLSWATTDMFRSRRSVDFTMGPDEFFPMGDNSPQSKDARLWSYQMEGQLVPPPAVDRSLLIGKAMFVYWPHAWYIPAAPFWPIVPNYQRIGFIR